MAIRQLRYNEDEILRKRCKEVKEVNDNIRLLLDDMLETLHTTPNGAAIAANQLGILKRLVVIDMGTGIYKLVNPQIIGMSGEQECTEGCLSFPNKFGKTIRPMKVTVQAIDENGSELILEGEGEMAKCLCHEIDHLDGIVFTDKVIEWL
ncbi:peptide deformylase [Mobilisporobacter senegalensis]|uniref:Peptide deformylase n=1 Tax=Mobilisporobacter senegalensis TaxID=1329262 RepID=A0A3N1X8R8_9FIRM|nr:peptide deformylase [Mobilisporobacter senegalensis]ROR22388.1 peptide deformylase [Mobilisporobacter senegalensis]